MEARRTLAEIDSVRKQLADLQQKIGDKDSAIKAAVADAQTEISEIVKPAATPGQAASLQDAFASMALALRVVEGGDRAVPSQAIAVYNESAHRIKTAIGEWSEFKTKKLPGLNQKLSKANLAPIAISGLP
jgi:hypothetical protein